MWLILSKWNDKNNELLFYPFKLPLSQCFRYQDHVCLGYSLLPSGLIEIKRKSFDCIFCVCPYARMPVYRVLFRLKFSSVSGHMIKFLLTEFGGASAEIIWFGVMKKRPRCARSVGHDPEPSIFPSGPTTQWTSAQYFGFVRHSFITHDVIEHEKWRVLFFFNKKCQALVFTPLKGLIFITRSITVQPKFLFFNAKLS